MAGLTTALIMGGAALAGAAVSSSAAKSAAKTTSQAAERAGADASAAAIAAGKSQVEAAEIAAQAAKATSEGNNALLKSIYDQNKMVLAPSMATGTGAQDAINAFLGLPVYKTEATPDYEAYVNDNPDIKATYEQYGKDFGSVAAFGEWYANNPELGGVNKRDVPTTDRQVLDTEAGARQEEAFAKFRGATGYDFAKKEALGALDQNLAARGMTTSGKSIKATETLASDLATRSAGQYLNYLGNQQGVGSSAINALTGLSTQYGGNVVASNTAATTAGNAARLGANTGANALMIDATGTTGALGVGAANAGANAGLVSANALTNLLGQGVSAYGAYKGTTSYPNAVSGQYGAATPSPYMTPPIAPVTDAYSGVY